MFGELCRAERALPTPAGQVQGARHHLLTGAGLASDQDAGIHPGQPLHLIPYPLHRGARRDERRLLRRGLDGRRPGHTTTQGGTHPPQQLNALVRLLQEIEGAEAHRLHRTADIAMRGQDDYRESGIARVQPL